MSCMIAIDIGNSQTTLGRFEDGLLVRQWRMTTRAEVTSDEIEWRLSGLLGLDGDRETPPCRAILATVVPALLLPWLEALNRVVPGGAVALDHHNCGLRVLLPDPAQVGPDRLANALGVEMLGLRDAIVVDLGTATTFDVVIDGAFVGGLICPGVETGLLALTSRAARLFNVDLCVPSSVIGRTTSQALQGGVLLGHACMIDGLTDRLRAEMGQMDCPVLATGGWSRVLDGISRTLTRIEPHLTLQGLAHFATTRVLHPTR